MNNIFNGKKIGFIGAGVMSKAIISGLLKSNSIPAENILAAEISSEIAAETAKELGINVICDNKEVAQKSDIIMLCVKPAVLEPVLYEIKEVMNGQKLVVSIAAGISTDFIANALEHKAHVVRVMPNTPAVLNEGMSAVCKGRHASDEQADMILELFKSTGRAVRVPEKLIDAVTAISGSGPAFVYLMIEAMADGGVRLGLTKKAALELAAQTFAGASKMVLESDKHPSVLKDEVTTPGGCTIAGLLTLEEEKVRSALSKTVVETSKAAASLAK